MTSLQPDHWHDLFIAVAGAAAALTGLIFVAVSINLKQILEYPGLPTRAVETLSILTGLLIMSVLVLVPGESRQALGAQLVALGVIGGGYLLIQRLRVPRKKDDPLMWMITPLAVIVAGTVPMIPAGISLLAGGGGGLYWLTAGTILAIVGAIVNAWILLVEIQR
jgi:modulator of FtsH protease